MENKIILKWVTFTYSYLHIIRIYTKNFSCSIFFANYGSCYEYYLGKAFSHWFDTKEISQLCKLDFFSPLFETGFTQLTPWIGHWEKIYKDITLIGFENFFTHVVIFTEDLVDELKIDFGFFVHNFSTLWNLNTNKQQTKKDPSST